MSIKHYVIWVLLGAFIGVGAWYYLGQQQVRSEAGTVQPFNFDRDSAQVDALFHKGDNWYWMICVENKDTYSVDHMLRYASSSQHAKKHDLIMKVDRRDDQVVGFSAYHQDTSNVYRILFLIVDQDFRRQGIARKLLEYVMDDIKAKGARKIYLATRNNNFRAQALYKSMGFNVNYQDDQFVEMSYLVSAAK